jgi:Domain of unknown function (DUF3854)
MNFFPSTTAFTSPTSSTGSSLQPVDARQLFIEATTPISESEVLGGNEGFIKRFEAECILGSAISPEMLALNIRYIEDTGRWEINNWLGQKISRFGKIENNWNYQSAAFFVSENGQIFNAKVANPKQNFKKSGGFGQETWVRAAGRQRKYEAVQNGGNRIFYPALDTTTRQKISAICGVELPLEGDIWPWLLTHPEISIGITEGAKKALALCCQGFICIAVLGIANWSVPKTKHPETGLTDPHETRILLPELAELAQGGRQMPIWYDQDDPKNNLKALVNAKREGHLLTAALKTAGADKKTDLLWWPTYLGKGIDDVIVRLKQQESNITQWIEETIALSKNAAIYAQIKRLYIVSEKRYIESRTTGGYLADHLDLKLERGKTHAIIAGTGAGKTTVIREKIAAWIAVGGFALVLTPTNNLGKQLAENVGLPHRHDYGSADLLQLKANTDGGFVCCLDSLPKLETHIPKDLPLLVVCEEADQLANHITNGQTLKGKYGNTLEAFSRLLTRAEALILAEARIPENTLRFFEQMSGKPTRVFIHELATQKRQVTCYSGQVSGFEALILQRLKAGERLIITADSQRELESIDRLIQQELRAAQAPEGASGEGEALPPLKGMRNDPKTSYLPAIKELTAAPNTVLAREQLNYLLYSPSCKSGWDLTGAAGQYVQGKRLSETQAKPSEHYYGFDRVMAIFRVLPTSDQIQMVARYRPDCPWDIYVSETIQVAGNETKGSPRALSRDMEAEAIRIAKGWGIPYEPSDRPPLEKIARDHYVVATARAGLEKRINRYSLVQRLTEDGHSVTEERLDYHKIMANRMKAVKEEIDRDWADAIADTRLVLTDDLEIARRLEQLEAPTPEQRAKAKKIRLCADHPGIGFDQAEICYQATGKYDSLTKAVKLEAAARHLITVAHQQKKATAELFGQSILPIHHLPHEADRAGLILTSGILELLASGQKFTSTSPEVLELKRTILSKAEEWGRYFGFNFTADQAPISFLTRMAKRLEVRLYRSRPGAVGDETDRRAGQAPEVSSGETLSARPYQYQVFTPELVAEQIELVREKINSFTDAPSAGNVRATRENLRADELVLRLDNRDRRLAVWDDQLLRLLDIRSRMEVRAGLLESALQRYCAIESTLSMDGELIIKSVDGDKGKGERWGLEMVDLATG